MYIVFQVEVFMKIIAHRGLSSKAPENTMAAFELACKEQRFFGIECDIHETKDHQFIIMHDDNLLRMTKSEGKIKEMTLDQIKSHKIKSGHGVKSYDNEHIPTLEEFLELCVYHDKVAVIEVKEVSELSSLTHLVNMIEDHPGLKTILISFNLNYLKYIRALSDTIELQLLTGELNDITIYDARLNKIDLSIWHELLTKENMKRFKKEGFNIALFTVNDPKQIAVYHSMGVDYLTTDK
ncbi:MAG TPA: hypothetical protein DEA30_09450 [Acholeplasmataceae bacterium]|nr:MAG: hypothetical protein A2Z84_03390 [Tenericutes bacterium GWA2_35_7]OHE43347.1 MAG: hypothetical protein A2221_06235 [Tenericutes bacterium RIFOXYA2_FULL_36_32]OHE52104.1 MAG: hypothetical protein A2518_00465 [Tenericutes bacterium RIFOXYD12_FULL_36_9]HAX03055.1 hypothetical protein [Acholeplasmataceae bacterium]HBO67772.1 hypothetical protein [Acholeplasmataceae bacterium]